MLSMAEKNERSNICHFTFNAALSDATLHVTGVQRSWNYLKLEFDRHSGGLADPEARYFQTLYVGPRLFAVDTQNKVYYHDRETWIEYLSARDVRYAYDPDFDGENETFHENEVVVNPQVIDQSISIFWSLKKII